MKYCTYILLLISAMYPSETSAQNYSRLKIVGNINVFIESQPKAENTIQYDTVGGMSAEIKEKSGFTYIGAKPIRIPKSRSEREIELEILSNFLEITEDKQDQRVNVYLVTSSPIKLIKATNGARVNIKKLVTDDLVMHLKTSSRATLNFIDVNKMVLNAAAASEINIHSGRATSQVYNMTLASKGNFRLSGETAKMNVSNGSEVRYIVRNRLKSMNINIANGSNMMANVKVNHLKLKSSTHCDVGLKGKARKATLMAALGTTLLADEFSVDTINIISKNGSEAYIYPVKALIGASVNNSKIYYKGSPKSVAVKTKVDSQVRRKN